MFIVPACPKNDLTGYRHLAPMWLRLRLHRYPIECRVPMCEMGSLNLRNQLGEVHVEGDDRHGDLPTFEDFRMDFADDAHGLTGDENAAGTAF